MVHRRTFLKSMAAAPVALAASLYLPGAAANAAGASGFSGYISNGGDAGVRYAYLFSGPNSWSTWLANVPVGYSINVLDYAKGEQLAPHNPYWYYVQTPAGTGWVYSGLVTNFAPVYAAAADLALPPGPIPGPAGDGAGRSMSISLSRQHLYAYDGSTLVLDTPVTTGAPELPTPTGSYSVLTKDPHWVFKSPWPIGSPYWYPDSPTTYALLFNYGGYFIHDAPWRPYYGPGTNFPHLDPDGAVRQGSHGCVNTPYKAAQFLYYWAYVGSPVMVID